MKADEVRLYALRGGLKKQAVCYTHFHSNKVFRGDLMKITLTELEFAEKKIDNIKAPPHKSHRLENVNE